MKQINASPPTFESYLEQDGDLILKIAIYNKYSSICDNTYAEICGGFIDGVCQWASHNIDFIENHDNDKYAGFKIYFNDSDMIRYMAVEKKIMNLIPTSWSHAKNLFCKFAVDVTARVEKRKK